MIRNIARPTALIAALTAAPAASQNHDLAAILKRINLPQGFSISVFAEVPNARGILVAADGTIYAGSRHGQVMSMTDSNADGVAEQLRLRGKGLNAPNSLASQDATLYIGLQDKIVRLQPDDDGDSRSLVPVLDGINAGRRHGARVIAFGPDRKLYVALGAPCNLCDLSDLTGKIIRMNPDGSGREVVADGVRNSVGFDWHPLTGDLWFTDNGADGMGDDIPPDELNRVRRTGAHFGFPYIGGDGISHPGFEAADGPAEMISPEVALQPHSASLGIDFYTGSMFPPEYRNDAFIAQHGSWNRSEPVGYRIIRVMFDDAGNPTGKQVFADGWLDADGDFNGRPVDLEELPDGSLLVSDDYAGVIYRIRYDG